MHRLTLSYAADPGEDKQHHGTLRNNVGTRRRSLRSDLFPYLAAPCLRHTSVCTCRFLGVSGGQSRSCQCISMHFRRCMIWCAGAWSPSRPGAPRQYGTDLQVPASIDRIYRVLSTHEYHYSDELVSTASPLMRAWLGLARSRGRDGQAGQARENQGILFAC